MPPAPAALALFAISGIFLLSGIVLTAVSNSTGRKVAGDLQTILIATRSRYLLDQVATTTRCSSGQDGCDGSCTAFDLASSVPTFAYFKFYNITNAASVTAGVNPKLEEVGPFACVTAPPHAEARITRVSTTLASDEAAETMTYTEALECTEVIGGLAHVTLYDKNTNAFTTKTAGQWIDILKSSILSGGDTVGTGGAPAFGSFSAHGNESIPNNYMRRVADDAPVLPVWPHAFLPDDDYKLMASITEVSVLQWYISSIGQTVSFSWEYPLYMKEPAFERWIYARFVGYLPESPLDLSSRGSSIFDKAYSYHTCVASGKISSVQLDGVSGYPGCAEGVGEVLSPDAFYIDVNLFLGIPSPIYDAVGGSGWQAYKYASFAGASDPNCTAKYFDDNVASTLWAWGFWGLATSGNPEIPYPSHTSVPPSLAANGVVYPTDGELPNKDMEYPNDYAGNTIYNPDLTTGYNPYNWYGGLNQGKWLAEFGVTRNGAILPAFAFSMMPKMTALMSPEGAGSTFPMYIMGSVVEVARLAFQPIIGDVPTRSTLMNLSGVGALYNILFYAHGWYTLLLYTGIYLLVFAICPTLMLGIYRMKSDASSM